MQMKKKDYMGQMLIQRQSQKLIYVLHLSKTMNFTHPGMVITYESYSVSHKFWSCNQIKVN